MENHVILVRIRLKMRNVSDKSRRGNEDTFLCSRSVYENRAVYELM